MKCGFVVFNDLTALDFIGVYDPVTRLKTMGFIPDLSWDVCARENRILDSSGLSFEANMVGKSLSSYDLVIVPGGFGTRSLVNDKGFIDWLKTAASCPLKASVCTGSLLWGACGFLAGKQATTHPSAYEDLAKYCETVKHERIVDEGNIITARGVTAGIDLGLYLCGKIAGETAREKIARQMDYSK